jgi:hypothetical protein
MNMDIRRLINHCLIALTFLATSSYGHEYAPGTHEWKVPGGVISITSGLLTNGMALYVYNYSFYFQRNGEKDLYQIPLVDESKPGAYELSLTSKAKEERMVKDARLEVRGKNITLLRAQSERENDIDDSPVVVTRYRLVTSEGDDWPYAFQKISSKAYPTVKGRGVDAILKIEVQKLK